MTQSRISNTHCNKQKVLYHWPVVSLLFFATGIPAIPAIFILSLVYLGPTVSDNFPGLINAVYFNAPLAIFTHGVFGIIFFLSMPFQFSPALRMRYKKWHQVSGYFAFSAGCGIAISAIWLYHTLNPEPFSARYFSLVILSFAICFSFITALRHILKRNKTQHRFWMIRATAATLAAVSPIFIDMLFNVILIPFQGIQALFTPIQHDFGWLIALLINLIIAEKIINAGAKQHI